MMKHIPIYIRHISKNFGTKKVVDDLSLFVEKGEIVTILGPNGAGKSTTINIMLGIVKPSKGEVLLAGKPPNLPQNRQILGSMLQHIGLPDTLKPSELIELWRSYYFNPLPTNKIIETAGLADILRTPFGKLSGGQKRRVAFGLAISGNPDILFLDEPSTGLDTVSRSLLWHEIKDFATQNKTVILCTHYLEEADVLSSRIVLMNKGKIIADDTPQNIKAKVGTKVIKCRTTVDIEILRQHRLVDKISCETGFMNIETAYPEALLRELFALDGTLTDLEVNNINLEDAFLKLTQ